MLQAADIEETDKVLVAGSAPAYTASIVARLAREVIATESDPSRASSAGEVLAQLGLSNVTFKAAAPAEGDPENGPYDVIVLEGATEIRPDQLYSQLKEGGRLLGVFAMSSPARAMIVTRSHGDFGSRVLFDAVAPVLPGLERRPAFVF